jgi:hypothetical protein
MMVSPQKMILRLLVNFCGKPRCHKCREGIGHGPYWYADWYEAGACIRRYIGKELPLFLLLASERKTATTRLAYVDDPAGLLDAAQPEPTRKTTYRLQRSFCGQARCRKCREGEGHGPYWYAYQTTDGRTTRTYIGKELPEFIRQQVPKMGEGTSIEITETLISSKIKDTRIAQAAIPGN